MNKNLLEHRLKRYADLIKNPRGVICITNPHEIYYLIGINTTYGMLMIDKTCKISFLTDSRYLELVKADAQISDIACIKVKGEIYDSIARYCTESGYEIVYFNRDELRVTELERVEKHLNDAGIKYDMINYSQSRLRKIKDKIEIEYIVKATEISHLALTKLTENIRYGDSELVLSNKLIQYMYEYGATGIAFPPIVAIDQRSAFPHSSPSNKNKISSKSYLLLVDFGCMYMGYCTDITRVFSINSVRSKVQDIYDIVYKSQQAAVAAIVENRTLKCSELSKIAESNLDNHPLIHSLGHGIGIEVHELPYINRLSNEMIEEFTAFTIEPGIYLPGSFGIRIEDTYIYSGESLLNNLYSAEKLKIVTPLPL